MFPHPQPIFLDDFADDAGVVTPETSVLMIVMAGFAAVLFVIVQSEPVKEALVSLINRALNPPN